MSPTCDISARRSGHYVAFVQRGLAAPAVTVAAATPAAAPGASGIAANTPAGSPVLTGTAVGAQPLAGVPAEDEAFAAGIGATASDPAHGGGGTGSLAAGVRPEQLAWFRVSDQNVKRVDWPAVAACEAYLLLYARC